MKDKKIVCKDCGNEFIFTIKDQEFYTEKGFSDPIRCFDCRQKRKKNRFNK